MMKIRHINTFIGLLVVCLIFNSGLVFSQPINIPIVPNASQSSFSNSFILRGDTSLIYGFKRDAISQISYCVLVGVSSNGTVVLERNYTIPEREVSPQYKTIVQDDGNIYLAMASVDSADNKFSHLFKLNANYDTVWTRQYSSSSGSFIVSSLQLHSQQGFVMLGIEKEQNSFESDIVILRIDSSGNELWRKKYGLPNISEIPSSIVETVGGDRYLIGAGQVFYPPNYPSVPSRLKGFLLISNSSGGFDRINLSRTNKGEKIPNGIIRTQDGRFVYASYLENINIPYTNQWIGLAVKIDSLGNEIWTKEIGEYGKYHYFTTVRESFNGNLVFSGALDYLKVPWVVTLSPSGDLLSQTTFTWPGYDSPNALTAGLSDIKILDDGRVAGCGTTISDNQNIWFYLSDFNGCFDQNCIYLGENVVDINKDLGIYPNPFQDMLYVYNPFSGSLLYAKLVDLNGQIVHDNISLFSETTNAFSLSHLCKGIYFLQISLPNGKFVVEKIIKQ